MAQYQANPFFASVSKGLDDWANSMDPESLAKGNLYRVNTSKAQKEDEILADRLAYRRRLAMMGLDPQTQWSLGASELTNPTQNLQTIHNGAAANIIGSQGATPQDLARASQLQGNAYNSTMHEAAYGIKPRQNLQVFKGSNDDTYIVDGSGIPQLFEKKRPEVRIVPQGGTVVTENPDGTFTKGQTISPPEKPPTFMDAARFQVQANKQAFGGEIPDVGLVIQQRLGLLDQNGQPLPGKRPLNPVELRAVVERVAKYTNGINLLQPSIETAMRELGLSPENMVTKEWDNWWWETDDEKDRFKNVLPNLGESYATSKDFRWDPATGTSPSVNLETVPVPLRSVAQLNGLGLEGAMAQANNPIAAAPLPPQIGPEHAGKYFYLKDGDEEKFVKVILTDQGLVLVDQTGAQKKAGR